MKNMIIIATVLILAASTFAGPPWVGPGCVEEIPVYMDIQPIAQLNVIDVEILLQPVGVTAGPAPLGTLNYTGVTSPSPVLTCNVPVTVSAQTVGVAPLVTISWQTALQGQFWASPGNPGLPSTINVDPPATPFILDVAVLATNVDMTVRPQGDHARVATTTVTVAPRP
jgi:hypothetical protein